MNKADLIDVIANTGDISKAAAQRVLDAVIGSITKTLQDGGQVTITGFGTFSVRNRAARLGRNPKTGETIQISASKAPGFKAGKGFKDALN